MSDKTMAIDINDFCGRNDPREWLCKPFEIKGRLAATDGKSAFLSNEEAQKGPPECSHVEKIERFLELAAEADFFPAPALTLPEKPICTQCAGRGTYSLKDCPECGGSGEATAETDYNTYDVQCRTCDREGKVDAKAGEGALNETCVACDGEGKCWSVEERMQIEGIPFDVHPGLVSRISGAPDLQIAAIKSDEISKAMAFKSSDGVGIIMGMRDKP